MKKILTISIAAYNVEKYLNKTLDSIVESGCTEDLDIIIVNDGSQDDTYLIAQKYEKQYPDSIRAINKSNGGHGSTINTGISEAEGVYFRALDGDDWVDSSALNRLVNVLKAQNEIYDMILSDYRKCFEDGKEEIIEFQNLIPDKKYSFDEIMESAGWMRYHTAIYRTELLRAHSILLDEKCFYVDTEFMILPIEFVSSIYYAKEAIYCYRLGIEEQSVSTVSRIKHIDDSVKVLYRLIDEYSVATMNNIDIVKQNYILDGIYKLYIWTIWSIILAPPDGDKKKLLKQVDSRMKKYSRKLYHKILTNEKGQILKAMWALRFSNYIAYEYVVTKINN